MIKETIRKNMIIALKEKESQKKKIYSLALQAIEKAEKDKQKNFNDKEIIPIIEKEIKQYKETLKYAEESNRIETIKECKLAINLLSVYIPEKMNENELKKYIESLTNIINPIKANKGLFMKELAKNKDKIDMKKANIILENILR